MELLNLHCYLLFNGDFPLDFLLLLLLLVAILCLFLFLHFGVLLFRLDLVGSVLILRFLGSLGLSGLCGLLLL